MTPEQTKKQTVKRWFTRKEQPQFPPPHWAAECTASELPARESGEPAALAKPTVAISHTDGDDKLSTILQRASESITEASVPAEAAVASPPSAASRTASAPTQAPAEKTTLFRRLSRLGKRAPTASTPASAAPIDGLPTSSDAPILYPPVDAQAEAIVVLSPSPSTPSPPSQETPPERDSTTTSTLVQRISSALLALPALTGSSSSPTSSSGSMLSRTLALANPEVLKMLSNPAIMNGRGGRSVWKALDDAGRERSGGEVMLCAPLGAESKDQVEVEEGEEVEIPEDSGEDVKDEDVTCKNGVAQGETEGEKQSDEKGIKGKGKKKVRKVRVFVPSKDKISFRATWWGFTLYLPPPVLIALNDKHLTAAKRSAMLFASLQWIVMKLPTRGLPPQAVVTVKIVRTLLPVLATLGTAISAAWAGIRSFDRGMGVKLSATWLMPLVMIPSAWEEADDFPLGMLGVREGEKVEYTGAEVGV
ncbi:hypothetical protein CALCODRAFT_504039 [Calocera cornea HHB12733]|uniref:Uncharacterized protein n=1 Tax=Calocera cornea HHB12733 TaxID=1353952 RepID=A0A165CMC5_9BASI|nr:hypothetical protein CALCODRAFT_504039 [Calocera cornea HHB12733]